MSSPPSITPDREARRSLDLAGWVFLGLLAISAVLFAVEGRRQWFFQDEWVFLSGRDGGSLHGLFDPHNEHWTTLPVLAYRALWNVVGVHTYKPYQAMSIGLHLVVATLLVILMRRRLGISPWVATVAGAVFLFYGSGSENVVWAFQISFTGAIAFGVANLLIADHPNPSTRRRVAGLACGLAALMCSGIGLIMAGVVGLALLASRGWRAAAWNTGPILAVYLAWRLTFVNYSSGLSTDVDLVVSFSANGLDNAVRLLGQSGLIVLLQLAVAVTGLAIVVKRAHGRPGHLRRQLAIPAALLVGVVAFFAVTGVSRVEQLGVEFATRSRYAYVAVALLLPVIALGFDAVVRRWPRTIVPVLLVLVAGIPANVSEISIRRADQAPNTLVLALADSAALADAPPGLQPFSEVTSYRAITAGWLREAVRSGRFPRAKEISPDAEAEAIARLTIVDGGRWSGPVECRDLPPAETMVRLSADHPVVFVGVLIVRFIGPDGGRSKPRQFGAFDPRSITTVGDSVMLSIVPKPGPLPGQLCR